MVFQLSPEYLSFVEQYANAYSSPPQQPRTGPPPRRPLPAYARQQQQLQQAYQNQRVPAVAPPRPRLTLHPQAQAQADAQADYQSQARLSAAGTTAQGYQLAAAYPDAKLGTFEQELLQLVSANQAQEFKLAEGGAPKQLVKQAVYPQYTQEVPAYQNQYIKPTAEPVQEEQYHVETSGPRFQQQHVPEAYTPPQPAPLQYHQRPQYPSKPAAKQFRPSGQYYQEPRPAQQPELNAQGYTAHNVAQAQANAEAQALAFQKITQASHVNHQHAALEQIRIVAQRHEEQSALEQIRQGEGVSEAGRAQIVEEITDPEAAYQAKVKAQSRAKEAEARRAQEAAEYKAHADAILHLQAQQQAHLKAQEDAHNYALNFEKNQLRAQAQAQALANAQAQALYKSHQQARANAQKEAQAAARAQHEARQRDPENTPVIQYLLPNNNTPLPQPNSYFTSSDVQKYQTSGSSYVPRSAPRPAESSAEEIQHHHNVNQPRQAHKHKIPQGTQGSTYVSQSGLLKKAPVKSLTIEEIIEQDQVNSPQIIRLPSSKTHTSLTQADLEALINAGYTVTPVPDLPRPTPRNYAVESTSAGYYVKKHNTATPRPEYSSYSDTIPRQRRPIRKQRPILQQHQESEAEGNEKVTFLVPIESSPYGTRRPPQRSSLVAEE